MLDPKDNKKQPLGLTNLNYLFNQAVGQLVSPSNDKKSLVFTDRSQILALVVHLSFIAVGFQAKFSSSGPTSSEGNNQETVYLDVDWNQNEPYVFQYKHPQSQLEFLTKAVSLFDHLVVNAVVSESKTSFTLHLLCEDFVPDQVKFPIELSSSNNYDLKSFFSSQNKFETLLTQIQTELIQKLIPGLHKDGYQEIKNENSNNQNSNSTSERQQRQEIPSQFQESGRYNQGLEDPLRFSTNPYNYGASDLDPLGGRSGPGLPRVGGGSALDPFGSFGTNPGGGMILGPNHPAFRGGIGPGANLPHGSVPPGARFDPITPQLPGVSGIPNPIRPRPNRGFPGEPNNDEFMPPGFGNDHMYM